MRSSRGWKFWLKEGLITVAIAAAVLFAFRQVQLMKQRGGGGVLTVGAEAPEFALADARSGAQVDLKALRGKPVILAFWATHCGPCRSELPTLERVYHEAAGRYTLITVAQEPPSMMRRFLAEKKLDLPVLVDSSGQVHDHYQVTSIPMTVIIDKDGAIVHDFVGAADEDILLDHMKDLGAI